MRSLLLFGTLVGLAGSAVLAGCNSILDFQEGSPMPATTASGGGGLGGAAGHGGQGGATAGSGGLGGLGGGGGAGGSAPPCHPPGLIDDFEDGQLAPLWSHWGPDIVVESAGRLHIIPLADMATPQLAGVSSVERHDLTDCSVWVENVLALGSAVNGVVFFQVALDADNYADIQVWQGYLIYHVVVGGIPVGEDQRSYDATEHRWWRIRDEASTLHLETSPDAVSWTVQLSAPSPYDVNDVRIGLGVSVEANQSAPGMVAFDNLNILP